LLRKDGNPYYLEGQAFHGIGGNLLLEHRSNRSLT